MKLVNHKYDGEISPVYFSLAMKRSYNIFIIYFGIFILCMAAFGYPANCIPVFFWLIGTLVARYGIDHLWVRWNFLFLCNHLCRMDFIFYLLLRMELWRHQLYHAADAYVHVFRI